METLIHKILRPLSRADKLRVEQYIRAATPSTLAHTLLSISRLVLRRLGGTKESGGGKGGNGDGGDGGKGDFVADNLLRFLSPASVRSARIVDVGGGNGDVLSALQRRLGGPPEQYVCVETQTDWVDAAYPFSHTNITYSFWDNRAMRDLPDESADVVLCMVALHHLPAPVQDAALREMARILKPGGRWLVKEHDASDPEALFFIEWEHHLYHILDCAKQGQLVQPETYLARSVHAFLPKERWARVLRGHGLQMQGPFRDRFLEGPWRQDSRNASNLFWVCGTKAEVQDAKL